MGTSERMLRRQPQMQPLARWQRVAIAIVLMLALSIGMALIIFQLGTGTFTQATPAGPASTSTDAPLYPPGMRYYYRRSQWAPLDQQEASPP